MVHVDISKETNELVKSDKRVINGVAETFEQIIIRWAKKVKTK